MKVGIIGGGAAGLWAACFLKKTAVDTGADCDITILEKGPAVGRKLLLTGHGRCNITNRKTPSELKKGYHEAGNFIYPSLNAFSPEDAINFIEKELKTPLKEEDNNRMFPKSDSARKLLEAITNYLETGKNQVKILRNYSCSDIRKEETGFSVMSQSGVEMVFDRVILASGGMSFKATGSDGSGYELAAKLGHTVTELRASLASIEVTDEGRKYTEQLSGISVKAGTSVFYDSQKKASGNGDVLFTHKGLSGPAIQEISREVPDDILTRGGWIELDLAPHIKEEELDSEIVEMLTGQPSAKLTNLVSAYVPQRVAENVRQKACVSGIYAREITRKARRAYVRELKHMNFEFAKAPDINEAYVTRGGIDLREVSRKTMESKLVPGLYLIGEILDIDGISGGYNLQACMSEAFQASKDILSIL